MGPAYNLRIVNSAINSVTPLGKNSLAQNRSRPNGNDDNTRPAAASFVHNMVASSVL